MKTYGCKRREIVSLFSLKKQTSELNSINGMKSDSSSGEARRRPHVQ
jgi:hypothetical protein